MRRLTKSSRVLAAVAALVLVVAAPALAGPPWIAIEVPPNPFDSASRDASAVAAVAKTAGARLVRCERPGVNRARNAGWRAGAHPVVLFTDDDVVVDAGWRDALTAALTADSRLGFVSGRILPPAGETPSRDIAIKRDDVPERYDESSVGNLGHGASLAVPRGVLEQLGGWDESLGVGGRFGSSPEHDLFDRCFAAGLTGRFEPTALAYHAQWRGPRRLLLLDARYGYGTGARLAKLLRIDRRSCTGSSTCRASADDFCHGCTVNRTQAAPSRSNSVRSKACREEDRAPVSSLALMCSTPRSGSPTHSRHPTGTEGLLEWPFPRFVSVATTPSNQVGAPPS